LSLPALQPNFQGGDSLRDRCGTAGERRACLRFAMRRAMLDLRLEKPREPPDGAGADGQMLAVVSLLQASAVWLDPRALADVVSLRDAGLPEWSGMVSPANGGRRLEVSAQ